MRWSPPMVIPRRGSRHDEARGREPVMSLRDRCWRTGGVRPRTQRTGGRGVQGDCCSTYRANRRLIAHIGESDRGSDQGGPGLGAERDAGKTGMPDQLAAAGCSGCDSWPSPSLSGTCSAHRIRRRLGGWVRTLRAVTQIRCITVVGGRYCSGHGLTGTGRGPGPGVVSACSLPRRFARPPRGLSIRGLRTRPQEPRARRRERACRPYLPSLWPARSRTSRPPW